MRKSFVILAVRMHICSTWRGKLPRCMKCQDSSIGRPGHRDPVQPGNIDSFGLPGSPGEREDVNNHNRLTKMTTFVSLKATFATYVILHVFAYYDYPAVSISVKNFLCFKDTSAKKPPRKFNTTCIFCTCSCGLISLSTP